MHKLLQCIFILIQIILKIKSISKSEHFKSSLMYQFNLIKFKIEKVYFKKKFLENYQLVEQRKLLFCPSYPSFKAR